MNAHDNAHNVRPARTERYDTIVIGAGQAGLAAGYHLSRTDTDFLILDAAPRIGESWFRRWDSLRLSTPAAHSGLPGMPFPAPRLHLPDKDEVGRYLASYADHFELPIRTNSPVTSVRSNGTRYVVDTGPIRYEARNVIVATGQFHKPMIPALASELSPRIHQVHSSEYRNPFALPPGPVLVVGAASSGAQIALEIARFRKVYLAGQNTGHIARSFLGRDIYAWLWPILRCATRATRFGRYLQRKVPRDPVVGIVEKNLADAGIVRTDRLTHASGGMPASNDISMDVSTIIWCTGFVPDFSWIQIPLILDGGNPRTTRGAVPDSPGLYFIGLRFLHSMTSALIGGVGDDAQHVAERIAARATQTR